MRYDLLYNKFCAFLRNLAAKAITIEHLYGASSDIWHFFSVFKLILTKAFMAPIRDGALLLEEISVFGELLDIVSV